MSKIFSCLLKQAGLTAAIFTTTAGATHALPFEDVTEKTGLSGLSKSTAAWVDFNNDGFVDLYNDGKLWRNVKGERFELVKDTPFTGRGTWADYDNDGYIDMFSWQLGGRLFRNIKGKRFELVKDAIPTGLPTVVSEGAAWFDLDSDGLLDIYYGGYEQWVGKSCHYLHDVILKNQGDGTFKEVWRTQGTPRPTRGVTAADYNEDGIIDVYASTYRLEKNMLWKNDANGNLIDVAVETKTAGDNVMGAYGHTIGSSWGDLDNDGHLDLFVGNFSHPPHYQDRPKFLKNLGPAQNFIFEDKSKTANLHWQESYASPTLGDYDNDGNLDLFFTAVYKGDHGVLYRNKGDWQFENVTKESAITSELTYQAAWGDFNNDGYLDLVTNGRLYKNPGGKSNWLKVKVSGAKDKNRAAIGAQVRIKVGEKTLTRQVESSTGQGNQNEMTLHFGLGDYDKPVQVEVRWLHGRQRVYTVKPNRLLVIKTSG